MRRCTVATPRWHETRGGLSDLPLLQGLWSSEGKRQKSYSDGERVRSKRERDRNGTEIKEERTLQGEKR